MDVADSILSACDENREEINELKKKLSESNEEINKLQKRLTNIDIDIHNMKIDIEHNRKEIKILEYD